MNVSIQTIEVNNISINIDDFIRIAKIKKTNDQDMINKMLQRLANYENTTLDAVEAYNGQSIEKLLLLLQIKYLVENNTIINARKNCKYSTSGSDIFFTYIFDALSSTQKTNKGEVIGAEIRKFINRGKYIINPWARLTNQYRIYKGNNSLRAFIDEEKKFLGGYFIESGNEKEFLWTPIQNESNYAASAVMPVALNNSEANEVKGAARPPLDIGRTGNGQEKSQSPPTPPGNPAPEMKLVQALRPERDPDVTRWVRANANGKCENCDEHAPFESLDGSPYLEIHHVIWLRDNGPDTVKNAIATCPNCHRELHHGANREALKEHLYAKIPRLIR